MQRDEEQGRLDPQAAASSDPSQRPARDAAGAPAEPTAGADVVADASAFVSARAAPRAGTYRGLLEAPGAPALRIDLRFDPGNGVVSADLFRQDAYYASLRGGLVAVGSGVFRAEPALTIFEHQNVATSTAALELRFSSGAFAVRCRLPEGVPRLYAGTADFASESFRVLHVEIDKMRDAPWPPSLRGDEIPPGQRPAGLEGEDLSLEALLRKNGIDARLYLSDPDLDGAAELATGRPGEEDRFDERELHEIMARHALRPLDAREWWIYLLSVTRFDGGPERTPLGDFVVDPATGRWRNSGVGTTGILFDTRTGVVRDPWSEITLELGGLGPVFAAESSLRPAGGFLNTRARQGAAVFWRELLDLQPRGAPDWSLRRQYLHAIAHELGHALNLAHTWVVGRPLSRSFMNYPQRFPVSPAPEERIRSYWRRFEFTFDPEELFHLWHGFYNEVVPGGRNEFLQWTPSSIFHRPRAGQARSDLELLLRTNGNRLEYRFTEPPMLEVRVENRGEGEIPLGRLNPSYGDLRFVVRRPDGSLEIYRPPVIKCERSKRALPAGESASHVTTLAYGARGFLFEAPGRYQVLAALPDPAEDAVLVSRPVEFWVRYPERSRELNEEHLAQRLFHSEAGLFLYFSGGEHLEKGRLALEEVSERFAAHPTAAHAHLALGMHKLRGQKRLVERRAVAAQPSAAADHLRRVERARILHGSAARRLADTLRLCTSPRP